MISATEYKSTIEKIQENMESGDNANANTFYDFIELKMRDLLGGSVRNCILHGIDKVHFKISARELASAILINNNRKKTIREIFESSEYTYSSYAELLTPYILHWFCNKSGGKFTQDLYDLGYYCASALKVDYKDPKESSLTIQLHPSKPETVSKSKDIPVPKSDRGYTLVSSPVPGTTILTVENSQKHYNLNLLLENGEVQTVPSSLVSIVNDELGGDLWIDHAYHPRLVLEVAKSLGVEVDPIALEILTGRWVLEKDSKYEYVGYFVK